ncbi:MAG: DUF2911 domain-containing protein [Flavobacteriaceae bacterium]
MKQYFAFCALAIALVFSTNLSAQDFSGLDKSPMDMATYPSSYRVSEKQVRVIYSRPQLKGRSMSELAPSGKVWRTGANEAVEITFYEDMNVGGTAVKAGTYSLFTIPGDSEWTVILNSKLNQWGAYSYDQSTDVARVMASASKGDKALEAFSIAFKDVDDGVHMVMGWGDVRVAVPMSK